MKQKNRRALVLASLLASIGVPMALAVTATGGNLTNDIGGYRIHTFTNSGTFAVTFAGNVEVLVVAGGGGGSGNSYGSGGGAGGLVYSNVFPVIVSNMSVTVGGGGAAGVGVTGSAGGNSVFGPLTALGGGGGGSSNGGSNGGNGGSGGGAYGPAVGSIGIGTQTNSSCGGYGNNGSRPTGASGGGGGGADAAGSGGNGGDGRQYSICGTGSVYYAGGGSGAGSTYSSKGGGGNSVGSGQPATRGAANSGGGGGGGWSAAGGAGGSGIVIVRYSLGPDWVGTGISNITTSSAMAYATLANSSADVSLFWDTSDKGTSTAAWGNTNFVGADIAAGPVSGVQLSNLSPGLTYVCRLFGSNATMGVGWSSPFTFTSLGAPSVDNGAGATNASQLGAQLRGTVLGGNPNPQVTIYWGTTDGGTDPSAWNKGSLPLGTLGLGTFATNVVTVLSNNLYWYRCYATNEYGGTWAAASTNFAPGLRMLLLSANEELSDGILTATNSLGVTENIRSNAVTGNLFWWADTNGDNIAGDIASAGLNLGAYNLTRQSDYSVGFTLNLNDGIQDRAITWPGVTGGNITAQRDTNGKPAAPITIRGATDITCASIDTHGASNGRGGDVTVTQSGNLTCSNIWTYGWYGASRGGNVTLTGGGPAAGTATVGSQIGIYDTSYACGALTIACYRAVSIGAGGIAAYSAGAPDGTTLAITNIGAGGVSIMGPVDHYCRGANSSSYTHPNHIKIATTGNVLLNTNVNTYQWSSGEWMYVDAGTISLTAGGDVTVNGAMQTYMTGPDVTHSRNGGAVVINAGGNVQLAGIDSHNAQNDASRYAGAVQVTAGGNINIGGTINLYARYGVSARGTLALTNTGRGSITLNSLNMTNVGAVYLNSGVGWSQIINTLTNFVTNYTSGSGTWVAPYVTTQTQLRTPPGQRIYYTYAAGLTNDDLGGYTYQVRNLQNTGAGGLLMVRVAGAPEIYNVGATNVAAASADMVANLTAGDAPATVTCYWGTNDAGSVADNWNNTNAFAVSSPGYVTNSVTGLEGGRTYFFRYFASNTAGSVWASDTMNFSTVGLPTVDNGAGPASITQTSALLQGHKLSGDASCQVWIYWGTADGATTKGAWNRGSVYIGTPGIDPYSTAVSGLPANQVYWYRNYISNNVGDTWSATSATFTTQPPAMVIGDIGLPEGPQGTANSAVFTVTLSATSAVPVSVDFATANGSAQASDSDYVATNGTLTIPPNAWSGTIAVPVIGDNKIEADENFYLNLSNPVYAITNNNRGTCTLTNDDFSIYVRGDGAGSDANDGNSWATALATLTNALTRAPAATIVRGDQFSIAQVWQQSTPIRFYVQASAPGQAYDVVARVGGPLDLDFEGGWENVTGAATQTGQSVVKDLDGIVNEAGISLTGANHNQWRRLKVNRFVFTNVTRGVEIDLGSGNSDKCDALLIVSNMTVDALTDGIYVKYMHTYSAAGAGGLARLTAGNVAISAGQGGAGHGVYISGAWQGSSITASGTNAATGEPMVSSITSACGDGVRFTAYNKEARDASFANTVIYNCATNGVNLDAAIQTSGGQNPGILSNIVRAAFTHCTVAGNGADGVHTLSSMPAPSWAAPTNCIFANNGGHGVNLDGGTGTVVCVESYNVFFNDDIWTNGVVQSLSGTTVAADPLFYGQRSKPAPWYQLASSSSPAFRSGNDGRNRGAYQENRIPGGTIVLFW